MRSLVTWLTFAIIVHPANDYERGGGSRANPTVVDWLLPAPWLETSSAGFSFRRRRRRSRSQCWKPCVVSGWLFPVLQLKAWRPSCPYKQLQWEQLCLKWFRYLIVPFSDTVQNSPDYSFSISRDLSSFQELSTPEFSDGLLPIDFKCLLDFVNHDCVSCSEEFSEGFKRI
jgi:hypothetical protein